MKVTRYGLCQDRFGGEAMDSNNDLLCVLHLLYLDYPFPAAASFLIQSLMIYYWDNCSKLMFQYTLVMRGGLGAIGKLGNWEIG